jgi:predicted nucleotidyltransferase
MPYESYITTHNAIYAPPIPTLKNLRYRRRLTLRLATLSRLEGARVTGSVARGDSAADSDIDLLWQTVAHDPLLSGPTPT